MPFGLDGSKGGTFPSWTTAGRPASPVAGQTGYNSTLAILETYNGTTWVPAGGIAGLGPAFGAYQSSAQTALAAGIATKIVLQTKEFDTGGFFDNVTNYRFQPSIAGYYQINGCIQFIGTTASAVAMIYKNGTVFRYGTYAPVSSASPITVVSSIVFLNGSTDYVELWGSTSASLQPAATSSSTYFNGALMRAA